MAKNTQTYPVTKNGKFIGYADAGQIARNKSLELFDEDKAAKVKAEAEVTAAAAKAEAKTEKVEDAKKAGGADSGAVKKGPAAK